MAKILVIANDETTILHFRREILAAFVTNNYDVTVCYPLGDHTEEIKKIGCKVENLEVSRHGKNVIQDLKLLRNCKKLIKLHQPDVVLTYTVKPNIYASIACQRMHVPYINNVTGLGSALQKKSALSKLVLSLQRLAYRESSCVFFQNEENCNRFAELGVVSSKTPIQILPGSGVNLEEQSYEQFPEDDGITRFVIVARIRRDKGYSEFFDAAEQVKTKYPNTEFHVIGWYEEENLRIRLDNLVKQSIIIYHGTLSQQEVHEVTKKCNCLVNPSYHEGMSNVLLEAAASGRPVIASRIPGCKETFDEGVSGFGCEVQDSASLVEAMEKMLHLSNNDQCQMGSNGRKKMERQFDRKFVAEKYISQIEIILNKGV